MLYQDYDATFDFCKFYLLISLNMKQNTGKPRMLEQLRHRHYDLLEIFAAFINHTMAQKYPHKLVSPFYTDTSQKIIEHLSLSISPKVSDILACFDFHEHEGNVEIVLKPELGQGG